MIKAGLDFGNSKISCIVADYKNADNINILSLLSIPSAAIKKNTILDYDNLFEQVSKLISETQKLSQTKLNSINLNCILKSLNWDIVFNISESFTFFITTKLTFTFLNTLVAFFIASITLSFK